MGFIALALAGCKSGPPPMPLEQLNAQQMRGHAVFQARCVQGHYDRKDKPLHGPPMLGVFKRPTLPSGAPATDERATATIRQGHGLMPGMGSALDQQDIEDRLA